MHTGDVYLALFNITDSISPVEVKVNLADLGLKGQCTVSDMWSGKEIGTFSGVFSRNLPAHGSGLYKITN
jgi:hypothetical protein